MTASKIRAVYVGGPWHGRTEVAERRRRRVAAPMVTGELSLSEAFTTDRLDEVTLTQVAYRARDGRDLDGTEIRAYVAEDLEAPPTLWEIALERETLLARISALEADLDDTHRELGARYRQVGELTDALEELRLRISIDANNARASGDS